MSSHFLVNLALQSIKSKFNPQISLPSRSQITQKFLKSRASFVTLHLQKKLKGCIGHVEPIQPLYQDVWQNAQSAAFKDPRFSPVKKSDLDVLEVEVSVLSLPLKISAQNKQQLLNQIQANQDGVVLKSQGRSSTFLPQVWQKISKKTEFLTQLSLKAGLGPSAWKQPFTEIFTYQTKTFKS